MDINSINKRIDRLLNTIEEEQSSHAMELTPERIEKLELAGYSFTIELLKRKGIIGLEYIDHRFNRGKEELEDYNKIVETAEELIKNPEKQHSDHMEIYLAKGLLCLSGDILTKFAPSELLDELKNKEILVKDKYSDKLELNIDRLKNYNELKDTANEEKTNS